MRRVDGRVRATALAGCSPGSDVARRLRLAGDAEAAAAPADGTRGTDGMAGAGHRGWCLNPLSYARFACLRRMSREHRPHRRWPCASRGGPLQRSATPIATPHSRNTMGA
jgi:hypothetical protein